MTDLGTTNLPETPDLTAEAWYDRLVGAYLAHDKSVAHCLNALLEIDPHHVRGWSAKAIFTMTQARSELIPAARAAAAEARAHLRDDRADGRYVLAAESLVAGDWLGAIAWLETHLEHHPADSMAAKMSHALRFMLGDAPGMLDSIERVLARVGLGHRHAGFLLGCKAFALEENYRFQEAEFVGRSAVERQPSDAWGMHAVSHVHEMTGRAADGLAWIEGHPKAIWGCANFRYHLIWHQALFLLELGEIDGTLDLYDQFVRGEQTDDFRDIANGASLLQRLELAGVAVGNRWEELAELCSRRIADRSLVFADLHYVMALAGAGRIETAQSLATSLLALPGQCSQQSDLARRVGALAAEAIVDHASGHFGASAQKFLAVRAAMSGIGGSHAQRDVFEQMMLDSMVRAGHPQAPGLLLTRLARRNGKNRFAQELLARHRQQAMDQLQVS